MLELLGNLLSLVQNNEGLTILIIALLIVGALVEFRRQEQAERRARDNFSIERRRLSEVNVNLDYHLEISRLQPTRDSGKYAAYMSLRLPIKNIGDGPIDILAVLVSGRLLSAEYKPGLGTRSRDVEWRDFQPLYWNEPGDEVFVGLSTTKNTISTAKDFLRLSANETGVLRRIDAVNNVGKLMNREELLVRHRVFLVARGYPLGEILRQLGGGPPDPTINVAQGNLQFQTLANPTFFRWQTVQEAVLNINRFVFRIAMYDPEDPAASGDPLGLLTDPDAWRIFLLYHWEFVDERTAAPLEYHHIQQARNGRKGKDSKNEATTNFSEVIEQLTKEVKDRYYEDLVLPMNWQQDQQKWIEVRKLCGERLDKFLRRWIHMRAAIELCQRYHSHDKEYAKQAKANKYVDEGYPALIFESPYYQSQLNKLYQTAMQKYYESLYRYDFTPKQSTAEKLLREPLDEPELDYRKRWFALMQEGYLVSKPFHRPVKVLGRDLFWRHRHYSSKYDIPADPRTLEPYVMRSHSLMTSVPTPGNRDSKERAGIPL